MATNFVKDKILGGKLTIVQPERGERVGIDPVLLAQTVNSSPNATAIDLGTGTGIIASLLVALNKAKKVVAVEIITEFAQMAKLTVKENRQTEQIEVVVADFRKLAESYKFRNKFDIVVANPPYRRTNSGKLPEDPLKAAARFELYCSLAEVIKASADLLKPSGSAWFVYPAERFGEMIAEALNYNLFLWQLRPIYPYKNQPAMRIIAAFSKQKKQTTVLPALIVHPSDGSTKYTPECEALLRGENLATD